MATLQIRLDDDMKQNSDTLFSALGLDTPTAVRMFLASALENNGFPFPIRRQGVTSETQTALDDARLHRNLRGPYATGDAAVAAMLAD